MINLATLNAAEAAENVFDLELLNPVTDKPTGLFIKLVGFHSDAVQKVVNEQRNDGLKRSFEATRKGKPLTATVEEIDRNTARTLAAATVGWFTKEGDKIEDGLPFGKSRLVFSTEEAERLYLQPGFDWLAKQVDKAISDLANFIRA